MRRPWFGGLVVLSALLVCGAPASTYSAGTRRLRAARTLHVKVSDARARGAITEYWFKKPNRFRIHYPDGSTVYCSGRVLVKREPGKKPITEPAPRSIPEDYQPMDFEPFFGGEAYGEPMGAGMYTFGGKKRRAQALKTTESAIFYGQAFLDARTGLPLGHRSMEYNDVTTDVWYPLVRLNERLPDSSSIRPAASPCRVRHRPCVLQRPPRAALLSPPVPHLPARRPPTASPPSPAAWARGARRHFPRLHPSLPYAAWASSAVKAHFEPLGCRSA